MGIHVQVNSLGQSNGFIQVYQNQKQVIGVSGLTFRSSGLDPKDLLVTDLMFSTFYGGSNESWAAPSDTFVQFRNVELAATSSLMSHAERVNGVYLFVLATILFGLLF
jgi:hypothetical protein